MLQIVAAEIREEPEHPDDYINEPMINYQYDYKIYDDKEYLDFGAVKKSEKNVAKP